MIDAGGDGPSIERPLLLALPGESQYFTATGRSSRKVRPPGRRRQGERLDAKFDGLLGAFEVSQTLPDVDPEMVVVLEVIDSAQDLASLASALDIEVITESEGEYDPSDDFPRETRKGELSDSTEAVGGTLHAVCASQEAARRLVALWKLWKAGETLPWGTRRLAAVFDLLSDVRPWGPQDRLRILDSREWLEGLLPETTVPVVVELWYRADPEARFSAEAHVRALIEEGGGLVSKAATVDAVGFHGLAARMPAPALRQLVEGNFEAVALIKASEVLYVRAGPQSIDQPEHGTPGVDESEIAEPAPSGAPVVCLLDGVPVANHRRLAGRVDLYDPDDFDSDPGYTVERRSHGTSMASLILWGDLSADPAPAPRRLLVRPVLRPALDTLHSAEEIPSDDLAPDLMERVFIELFDGIDGQPPAAPEVCIVNLSIGDPAMPFDTMPSAWARTLDWLSDRYGILIVVSAGNHPMLPESIPEAILSASGVERRRGIWRSICADAMLRRVLSPAESLNALTVGALHADASGADPAGSAFDPSDGQPMVSPVSALGRGNRRSIKPELAADGGRIFFLAPASGNGGARPAPPGAAGPGLAVAAATAASPTAGRRFDAGTSVAAALVSRNAAALHDVVTGLDRPFTRRERAAALKALLVHEARWDPSLETAPIDGDRAIGFGAVARNLAEGCAAHEAVILYVGDIAAGERQELRVPLPDGLAQEGVKRVTATLAWFSPINWRHRQYRRAKLSFSKPSGLVRADHLDNCDVPANLRLTERGTVQHHVYETRRASAAGAGDDMVLRVECREQAGGLDGRRVTYAAALSLWCAPDLGVAVYEQVRERLQPLIRVTPGS